MTRFMALKMMFLGFIIAVATVACGSVKPNGSASPPDAQTPADAVTVDNDRPATTPDVAMTSDTPSPPPPDVQMPVDSGMPVIDVAMSTDAGTPVDSTDATMVAEATVVDSGSVAFDPNICSRLRSRRWRVRNTPSTGDFIRCDMNTDGSAHITIGATFALTMQSGYDEGRCANRTCTLPEEGAPDGCVWNGLSVEMESFEATCNSRMMHIEAVP